MANLVTAAIIVGFAIGGGDGSWVVLAVALGFWAAALAFALWVMEKRT